MAETTDPASLAVGERAVAVTPPAAVPALEQGDLVDVVAIGLGADGVTTATDVASVVRVVGVDDRAVVLAVPAEVVRPLLAAQAAGPLELVRRP